MPLPPKRRYGRRILLITTMLFVLIGATVFFLVHSFNQNVVSSANPVSDLPTTIHWQQVGSAGGLFPTLVAAPRNPATLYICGPLDTLSETGSSFARSTDAGIHWQTSASTFSSNGSCKVAVAPTDASNLYVVLSNLATNYENGNVNVTYTLKHSSDGGQTWTNIAATLLLPSGQSTVWEGDNLTFVGQRLFATQDVHGVYHLISSVDGGQTWVVVGAQLFQAHHELQSYAVDPAQTSTIYEFVGPIVRFEAKVFSGTPPPMPTPQPISDGQLYKTTDDGASWQKLLASVPYGSKIQLASSNSHLLYLGGMTQIDPSSLFHMQCSRDGGATWQTITLPANTPLLNNWFVDAHGLLYDTVKNIIGPRSGDQSLTPVGLLSSMQRYNPSTRRWSTLNLPAGVDSLLAITPDTSRNGDIIWMTNIDGTLFYRGTL